MPQSTSLEDAIARAESVASKHEDLGAIPEQEEEEEEEEMDWPTGFFGGEEEEPPQAAAPPPPAFTMDETEDMAKTTCMFEIRELYARYKVPLPRVPMKNMSAAHLHYLRDRYEKLCKITAAQKTSMNTTKALVATFGQVAETITGGMIRASKVRSRVRRHWAEIRGPLTELTKNESVSNVLNNPWLQLAQAVGHIVARTHGETVRRAQEKSKKQHEVMAHARERALRNGEDPNIAAATAMEAFEGDLVDSDSDSDSDSDDGEWEDETTSTEWQRAIDLMVEQGQEPEALIRVEDARSGPPRPVAPPPAADPRILHELRRENTQIREQLTNSQRRTDAMLERLAASMDMQAQAIAQLATAVTQRSSDRRSVSTSGSRSVSASEHDAPGSLPRDDDEPGSLPPDDDEPGGLPLEEDDDDDGGLTLGDLESVPVRSTV